MGGRLPQNSSVVSEPAPACHTRIIIGHEGTEKRESILLHIAKSANLLFLPRYYVIAMPVTEMGKCGGGGAKPHPRTGAAWRRADLSQPPSEVPCRRRLDQQTSSISNTIVSIRFCCTSYLRGKRWMDSRPSQLPRV
jgi:hypothetical protein